MEDNFITMISKGKGLYPNLDNDIDGQSIYDDMGLYNNIKVRLIIPANQDRFLDGVKDIYHIIMGDYYEMYGETVVPSIGEISDFIDEENSNLIYLLLGEDNVHVNNILTIYTGEITLGLESDVEEALRVLGLPFKRGDNDIVRRTTPLPYHDPFQMRMFGDDLYER